MLTHANGDNVQSNMFKHATDNKERMGIVKP